MNLKIIFNIIVPLSVILIFTACDSNTDFVGADEYAKIYMPQALEYPAEHSFEMSDNEHTVIYGAAYGGPGFPGAAIDVYFDVNSSLVDSFNIKNGTSYTLMPEGSYELSKMTASIPEGGVSTKPLELKVKTIGAIEPVVEYLLPVTIKEINGNAEINPDLQTAYFLIKGTFTEFDREGWQVFDVDSEQAEYPASNVLDGKTNTFWHTQYNPVRHPLPHDISIDLGEVQKLHGLRIIRRQGVVRGSPKELTIEVSSDGNNWMEGESFSTTFDTEGENTFYLSSTREARYIKLTTTATNNNTDFTHLAEIYAF